MTKAPTVAQMVADNIATLRALPDHRALAHWAENNGLMSHSRFPRFKKALLAHGIDYADMRQGAHAEALSNAAHSITLYSDAKANAERFAVCDQNGEPLWYGRDFDGIDEQSAAELAAVKKAVWLAGKIRSLRNLDSLKLRLMVDAQWLIYANAATGGGQAAKPRSAAAKAGITLEVEWVPGVQNTADKYTTKAAIPSFMKWTENIENVSVQDAVPV